MKILHTADIHIGYTTHGKLDSETGLNTRLLDFKRAFQFMTDHAVKEDVDVFLFCGDAFRDASPSPTEQKIFSECLKPLIDARIPIVMAVGNHDHPFAYGKAHALQIYEDLLPNVAIFSRAEARDVQTKSGPLRIIGLPWPIKSNIFSKKEFSELSPEALRDKIHDIYVNFLSLKAEELRKNPVDYPVIVAAHLHLDTAEITENSERQTLFTKDPLFSVGSVAKPEFQYVALGHIHKHQNLNGANLPPVVYSGSPERISFAEWRQPKGFVMVEIDGQQIRYRHIETPARPFLSLEIDVSQKNDSMKAILAECQKQPVRDAVVRVRVRCSDAQKSEIQLPEIKEALSEAFLLSQINVEVAEKTNRSREPALTKSLSINEALETFLEAHKTMRSKKEKVMAVAAQLINEHESGEETSD